MNKTQLLSTKQLLDIFSASHIATAIYTTDDLIIEAVTDAMLTFWGKKRDIVGLPLEVAVPELLGQPFLDQMKKVIRTGQTFKGLGIPADLVVDGQMQTKFYDYEYKALYDDTGKIYCLLHTASDSTERVLGLEALAHEKEHLLAIEKEQSLNEELATANEELGATNEELKQTQEQLNQLNNELEDRILKRTVDLEQSEARMRYMIDDAPVAIAVLTGADFVIESANLYMLKIWGKPASIVGLPLIEAIPELKGQSFLPLLSNVYENGVAFTGSEVSGIMEYAGTPKEVFTNFVYKPLKDALGRTYSIMVVATEVTEQVLARKVVEATKHRLESMVRTTPVAMTILTGKDLVIEQANEAMYQIWQRTEKQTTGKKLIEVFPELVDQPFPQLLANVFETGKSVGFPSSPVTVVHPDGMSKDIFVNFSYDPIFNLDNQVESILASVVDVTESVKAHQKLKHNERELQSIIERLEKSETRFSFLLNSLPQQVWTADADGLIDYVNNVVCKDFGVEMEAVIGHSWQKFIHPDDLANALDKWMHALENGNEYLVEFRLLFSDGTYHWHLARAVPLIENGKIQLWLGTNTNIELQKLNEQKKDEFLSIASHELKTPLTSIKAFNQLVSRGGDPERVSVFVKKSAEHIQRLEKLIADLLDVTRMNAGKLEYDMKPFSFKQLLTDSVENIQQLSPSHQITLQHIADVSLTGDHFRLEQVMINFLSNAVKYSPNGKRVLVDSRIENNKVIVSIQDFGIGIDQAHINKLFDRYYRVDNTAMRFDGLGLGLFISSEIIKQHHGSVWIESTPGQGSTFYFSIPLTHHITPPNNGINIDIDKGKYEGLS